MNDIAAPLRLTSLAHGGGCGCKIAPGVLSEILHAIPRGVVPEALLRGSEDNEDAAVYKLNDSQALVATTDFFTPIVDDPYDFGRIAATNAISDVYAMGGRPIFALAILGMPLEKLPLSVIGALLLVSAVLLVLMTVGRAPSARPSGLDDFAEVRLAIK